MTITTDWIQDANYDLSNLITEGECFVSDKVLDNPTGTFATLSVKTTKTYQSHSILRVTQTIFSNWGKPGVYYRFFNVKETDGSKLNKPSKWVSLTYGSQWVGKHATFLGTSKGARTNNYVEPLANMLGMTYDNRSFGGGGITPGAYNGNTTMQQIRQLKDEQDLVMLDIGPNDTNYPLGKMGDTTEETFYGCLYIALKEISQRVACRVVITITTQTWATSEGKRVEPINLWFTSNRFKQQVATKEMANLFGFPVIDFQANNGLGGWFANNQTYEDRIHESALGHLINAEYAYLQMQGINPMPVELELASDSPYRV